MITYKSRLNWIILISHRTIFWGFFPFKQELSHQILIEITILFVSFACHFYSFSYLWISIKFKMFKWGFLYVYIIWNVTFRARYTCELLSLHSNYQASECIAIFWVLFQNVHISVYFFISSTANTEPLNSLKWA